MAKNSLFGFLCHKLNPLFPLDMPRAQSHHRIGLVESKRAMLLGSANANRMGLNGGEATV